METGLAIRAAATEDTPVLVRIINTAYEVERFFVDGPRTSAEEVGAMLGTGTFLMAEGAGGTAGCVYVEVRGTRGYFGMLAVDPSRQGQGIGRRLVSAAEEHCRNAGCSFMDLAVVDVRAELPPFYRTLGYVEAGTAPFKTPSRIPCCLLLMSKPLEAPTPSR